MEFQHPQDDWSMWPLAFQCWMQLWHGKIPVYHSLAHHLISVDALLPCSFTTVNLNLWKTIMYHFNQLKEFYGCKKWAREKLELYKTVNVHVSTFMCSIYISTNHSFIWSCVCLMTPSLVCQKKKVSNAIVMLLDKWWMLFFSPCTDFKYEKTGNWSQCVADTYSQLWIFFKICNIHF